MEGRKNVEIARVGECNERHFGKLSQINRNA